MRTDTPSRRHAGHRLVVVAATALVLAVAAAASTLPRGGATGPSTDGPGTAGVDHVAPDPGGTITVHGAWRITVHEEDGAVVATHGFSNLLVDSGRIALAELLAADVAAAGWQVTAGGAESPCGSEQDPASSCLMHDGSHTGDGTSFGSLAVATDAGALILEGSFAAPRDGRITTVGTQLRVCPADGTGTDCVASGFTQRSGLTDVEVTAGQIVDVEVRLSFE